MTISVSKLGNGLKIATRSMPHATTLSIGIWVNAGARDERDDEQGIAHMLEHMAFKGTKRRDAKAIATEVENVGGFINAHTSLRLQQRHQQPHHFTRRVELAAFLPRRISELLNQILVRCTQQIRRHKILIS